MQEYLVAVTGGIKVDDEQVEVTEVEVQRDQQLPADLERFEEKSACQRPAPDRPGPRGQEQYADRPACLIAFDQHIEIL